MRRVLIGGLVVAVLAGCAVERKLPFEPRSSATQVTGTLLAKDDQRPVDGPMWLTVEVDRHRTERVRIPSLFTGQPPSTETLALQQKVDQLRVGDRLTATGTRDDDGTLSARRIEILD